MNKAVLPSTPAEDSGFYRLGGLSAILLAVGYIAIIPLYLIAGPPPSGGEPRLQYLAGKAMLWWLILAISVLTDLLFIPLALSLYLALKGLNRNAMLIAVALMTLFVVLDLAVTWTNYGALLTLSSGYAGATTGQRATYVAAAGYSSSVLSSGVAAVYTIMVPSLAILIVGLVMLKGVFHKGVAYLAVVTGAAGILSVVGSFLTTAFNVAVVLTSALTTIWILAVGIRLFRLGSPSFRVR
jgi:hypothetical protein